MSSLMSSSLRWGAGLGLVNALWLYVSFWLGLHTAGPVVFQAVPAGWFVLTSVGYVLALRAIVGTKRPTWSEGLRSGVTMAIIGAVFGALQQVGYFLVVHPEWPDVMRSMTRERFEQLGASPEEVARRVAGAESYFTLPNYALQSAIAALVLGALLTVIITALMRRFRRN